MSLVINNSLAFRIRSMYRGHEHGSHIILFSFEIKSPRGNSFDRRSVVTERRKKFVCSLIALVPTNRIETAVYYAM